MCACSPAPMCELRERPRTCAFNQLSMHIRARPRTHTHTHTHIHVYGFTQGHPGVLHLRCRSCQGRRGKVLELKFAPANTGRPAKCNSVKTPIRRGVLGRVKRCVECDTDACGYGACKDFSFHHNLPAVGVCVCRRLWSLFCAHRHPLNMNMAKYRNMAAVGDLSYRLAKTGGA